MTAPDQHHPSSRTSAAAAGWGCRQIGSFAAKAPKTKRMSWFNPRALWESRNDVLARSLADPTERHRQAVVGDRSDEQLAVDLTDRLDTFSFLLLGDTGEGDMSQYALTTPISAVGRDTEFMFICSDVLYPIGNINEYENKFYRPYAGYAGPIYAIPGNHDWYDDLDAFLYHLCNREAPRFRRFDTGRPSLRSKVGWSQLLWRKPATRRPAGIQNPKSTYQRPDQKPQQPGPYYVLDTKHVRFVCIDTGIQGRLDRQQGEWLERVSRDPRPKVLLTGSPIWVDGEHHEVPILDGSSRYPTVDSIVRDPDHRYVAAIGGDIHNYQRYPVTVGDRTIQYIVSGGGGAFMHATHKIPDIDTCNVPGVSERDFRLYPLRADSLAAYSKVLESKVPRIFRRSARLGLTPDEAATFLVESHGMHSLPSRGYQHQELSARARRLAQFAFLVHGRKSFYKWFSPWLDWDTPPFFKQFLRLDVGPETLHIRSYGVTGCADHENDPPLEDELTISLMAQSSAPIAHREAS